MTCEVCGKPGEHIVSIDGSSCSYNRVTTCRRCGAVIVTAADSVPLACCACGWRNMGDCPTSPCVVCNEPVCTLELDECSAHRDGCELNGGGWTCSEACYDKATADDPPESFPSSVEQPR